MGFSDMSFHQQAVVFKVFTKENIANFAICTALDDTLQRIHQQHDGM
jgi:hypothetical protein